MGLHEAQALKWGNEKLFCFQNQPVPKSTTGCRFFKSQILFQAININMQESLGLNEITKISKFHFFTIPSQRQISWKILSLVKLQNQVQCSSSCTSWSWSSEKTWRKIRKQWTWEINLASHRSLEKLSQLTQICYLSDSTVKTRGKTDMEDISEFGLCPHPAQVVQSTTETLLAVEPELIDDLRQFSSNLFPRKENCV